MPPKVVAHRFKHDRPLFVRDNINSIHDICNTLHISYTEIAHFTGIRSCVISGYANGAYFPNKEKYNKLAEFFDWEVWT